jgi:hypothetical protein
MRAGSAPAFTPSKEKKMQFLSTEWFSKVAQLREAAGPIELPPQIAESVINVTLTDRDEGNKIHIAGGEFVAEHADNAGVTVGLTADLARKLFLEMDSQAGMQAFFAGEIKVEGDVSKLMALQSYQPDAKQKALMDEIIAITD